jgi:hypothetical protein
VAHSLRFDQELLAAAQLLLGLLPLIDVRQQVVPADDAPLDVAQRVTP